MIGAGRVAEAHFGGEVFARLAEAAGKNRLGCILPTHDVTGSEEILRCARRFFVGILTYFKEKWRGIPQKGPLPGCVGNWKNTPWQEGRRCCAGGTRSAARQKRRGLRIRLAWQADGAEAEKFGGEGSG